MDIGKPFVFLSISKRQSAAKEAAHEMRFAVQANPHNPALPKRAYWYGKHNPRPESAAAFECTLPA
jgi:hypothetical protein